MPEPANILPLWWLSFCDASKPAGSQFLGLVLVRGVDMVQAVKVAHVLGINPGGQVKGIECDPQVMARLSFSLEDFANRILDRREAQTLARDIATEIGA